MRKMLHPHRREVTVVSTDGSTYVLPMLMNKNPLKLEVDPRSHAIWNEGTKVGVSESKGQLAKFHRRFKK